MKIVYPVKTKKSFKENVTHILPLMFDNMILYKERVTGHPRMKNDLHRMRITGKPMRYIMEIMEPFFGRTFGKCLNEIKNIIEMMGNIHDCDVFIVELKGYLTEIRAYNRTKNIQKDKFNTSAIIKLIAKLKEKRKNDYSLLCDLLDRWEKDKFRNKLIISMQTNRTNEINYFKTPV
jgi:CHAD domain-containing protein